MICGFIGVMGSGKTLTMTREILKYYRKGFEIHSNYHLNIPYKKLDFETLYNLAEKQEGLRNIVIALDEIHIVLDSRSGMNKKSKVLTFWLNQTRKMGVKLLYTTQYLHQVDKRLRSGTDFFAFCEGIKYNKKGKEYFIAYNTLTDGNKTKPEMFVGNNYFPYYDTNEVIAFMNKDNKEKEVET